MSIWDTTTGEKLDELSGHSSAICCVRFTCDGKTLASSSMDKTVRLWHLNQDDAEDEQPDVLYHHLTTVDEVSFSARWNVVGNGRGKVGGHGQ